MQCTLSALVETKTSSVLSESKWAEGGGVLSSSLSSSSDSSIVVATFRYLVSCVLFCLNDFFKNLMDLMTASGFFFCSSFLKKELLTLKSRCA